MGKAKTSRKGKKAWRANISTQDIDDFYEKSNKDALSGGPLAEVESTDLFFEDKTSKELLPVRKIEKARAKVLQHESVLQKNPFVVAVSSSKPDLSLKRKQSRKNQKEVAKPAESAQDASKKNDCVMASGTFDLWGDNGQSKKKAIKMPKQNIPAVEIDSTGCSYNPPEESHKDALALAVAEEMQKVYKDELGPELVPLTVPSQGVDERDEEVKYFLDADDESEDEANEENPGEDGDIEPRKRAKKVTRVQLNRRARGKAQQKIDAEKKKKKALSKEIDSIPDIIGKIAKEDEEKLNKRIRRAVAMQDRLKTKPPRFGKHKFKPAPTQVLLSEEITGSLRQIKGCATLVRDRYKSLEKRGLIIPTARSNRK